MQQPPGPPPLTDGLLIAACCGLAYGLLAPDLLWGSDSLTFLHSVASGGPPHTVHLLYVPIARLVAALGGQLGLDSFLSLRAASVVSTALGLLALHRAAALLGATRALAAAVTLTVAVTPAVAFFAMMVEIQGVFFGLASLAWLAAVRCRVRPSMPRVALLGAATGLAAMVHSSGNLLPLLLGVFLLLESAELRRRWLPAAVAGACGHVAVPVLLSLVGGLPVLFSLRKSFHFVNMASELASDQGTAAALVLLHEWLIPYAPLWLAAFMAWRAPGGMRRLLSLHALALVYLVMAWPLLSASWSGQVIEHGGYFLPLALPLAWLALGGSRPVAARALVLAPLGALIAAGLVWDEASRQSAPFPTEAAVEATAEADAVLLSHSSENVLGLMRRVPLLRVVRVDQITGITAGAGLITSGFNMFMQQNAARGQRILMTGTLWSALEQGQLPLWRHIRKHFRLQPLAVGASSWFVVTPR